MAEPMDPSVHVPARPKNWLLSQLPRHDFERLMPYLTTITVERRQVLQKAGERVRHVYFPNGGVYSVISILAGGGTVETASVGLEGMLGIEAFLCKEPVASGDTIIHVPDTSAERLSVDVLKQELSAQGALATAVGRYAQCLVAQLMQSVACVAAHPVRQRAARWLLTIGDRMASETFLLSHEWLAVMLGASRPTVSGIAASLQREGLVQYAHGRMRIVDRAGLEAIVCECYSIVKSHRERLRAI
jgi:CRP-like cAMP-binding protein